MSEQFSFVAADDGLWRQYDELATRSYGHPVGDITHLRAYADLRVAVRGGRVVAGGLGLLVHQYFGGAPIPSACLGAVAMNRRERHGMSLVVHDFWAGNDTVAAAMLAFLGRHNTRADTIDFRRGALPPYPALLHNLHRYRVKAEAWHPWMLRILDIPEAVRLRGWPADLDITMPIEIESDHGGSHDRYLLQITTGSAELTSTNADGAVTVTRRQLAVWFAGGYQTVTAARMAGVHAGSDQALATLIRSTTEHQPWLPDHF